MGFRPYRLLWTGAFLSSIGTWTQDVALSWLIHTSYSNPVYLGLRAFAAEAPLLAFMMLGGAVADRVDRRRILLTSQILQMSFAFALLALYAGGRLGIAADPAAGVPHGSGAVAVGADLPGVDHQPGAAAAHRRTRWR